MVYLKLIRINQWYKNFVVFLPLIFAAQLFNKNAVGLSIMAFFAISFISSAGYIINDIIDKTKDKFHPEKKKRPIASKKISVTFALIICLILIVSAFIVANNVNKQFVYFIILIFVLMQIYTFLLKNEAFVDIIIIATLFVIRAVAGAVAIKVRISPWLILCMFFLSFLLAVGKRKADLKILGDNASNHKSVYNYYNLKILNIFLIIAIVSLIISYSLYSFLSIYSMLIISLPFALYLMLRYVYHIYEDSPIARNPELFLKDKKLVVGIVLWLAVVLLVIY